MLVTETFAFDGGRDVTTWVPDGPPRALVIAADGRTTAAWGADLDGVVVVGVHGLADETARLHEYSPVFDAARFAAHEAFVVDEVVPWARARFADVGAARTAVLGCSAGGELALALGLQHPHVFGVVLCGSPGAGYRPGPLPDDLPRTCLVAGTAEPFFLANATRWADALTAAGADVVLHEREGTHGPALWRAELPAMVAWAFG